MAASMSLQDAYASMNGNPLAPTPGTPLYDAWALAISQGYYNIVNGFPIPRGPSDANGEPQWYLGADGTRIPFANYGVKVIYPTDIANVTPIGPVAPSTPIPAPATYTPSATQGSPSTPPQMSSPGVLPTTTNVGNNGVLNAVQGAASGLVSSVNQATGLGLSELEWAAIAAVGLFVAFKVFGGGPEGHRGRY